MWNRVHSAFMAPYIGTISLFLIFLFLVSCRNRMEKSATSEPLEEKEDTVHRSLKEKEACFIVISKKELRLYIYESVNGDTMRVALYPVALGKNLGNKEQRGDMKTPESSAGEPFIITSIEDASDWHHDFHDGRGSIKAYGHWFLRLKVPGHKGIGIHGSTNNEQSIPGRASEGCIRLHDSDIMHLKEHYAFKGMKVIIKGENEEKLPFEQRIN